MPESPVPFRVLIEVESSIPRVIDTAVSISIHLTGSRNYGIKNRNLRWNGPNRSGITSIPYSNPYTNFVEFLDFKRRALVCTQYN